jgi:NAD(P)-dependent dehydrogenase (short-subunit alcohol dehydrogenase family)
VRIVLSDVEAPALAAAVGEIAAAGVEALGVRCDVRDWDAVHDLADRATSRFGQVDLLFSNAGISTGFATLWATSRADWEWTMQVDLWGAINGIAAFVPAMVERNSGHVVNTASLAGLTSPPYNGPYNAAKHAVVSLSETLRNELDIHAPAVGVTVVCPGGVATNIGRSHRNRPAELAQADGARSASVDPTEAMVAIRDILGSTDSGAAAEAPAEMQTGDAYGAKVLEYVEADRLHMVMEESSKVSARLRIDRLVVDLD